MSDGDLTPRPLRVRKQRQYNTTTTTHRYKHENGKAASSASAFRNTDGRRVVSANNAIRKQAITVQNESAPSLRRQPSFKHRLLNRMMSGLATRTLINCIDEEDGQMEQTLFKPRTSRDTSRSTAASSNSDEHGLSDLERTLATFPTPPTSNVTSPSTNRSSESAESPAQACRDLCVPSQDVTLAAELKIIPFHDRQKSDRTTLAAIEISATANDTSLDNELQPNQNAMDVAVVIDNSLYNSPATLMASCEITSLLASLLDSATDRIAILCTMSTETKQTTYGPTILSSLNRINTRRLKATLNSVASSTAQPDTEALAEAIKHARRILVKSRPLSSPVEPLHDTFGHIIVLTADTSGLCRANLNYEALQTHILCLGLPPQRRWDEIECNGWKMWVLNAYLTRDRPHHLRSKRDSDPYSLDSMLQALVRHARRGKLAGFLTDVILETEPRSGCSIEKTMGWSTYSKLRIGEVKTILVRLVYKCRSSSVDYVDTSKWSSFNAPANGDDLIAELDQMLGLPKDGMMTAKLRYKHSSLPASTTCTTFAKCLLQLPLPMRESKQLERKPLPSKSTTLVHQRLAEYYATYHKPQDALSSFRREFGEGACRSACPIYINALTDELRYQARISERIAIQNSPQKSTAFEEPHPGTRVDYLGLQSDYRENYKPGGWISVPEEVMLTPGGSHVNVAEQLGLDDARKIWNDLRNMSRGDKNENRRKASTSPAHQERTKKITEIALKNKRSVGESTIRSFSTPLKISSKSGLITPWQ